MLFRISILILMLLPRLLSPAGLNEEIEQTQALLRESEAQQAAIAAQADQLQRLSAENQRLRAEGG